MEITIKAPKGVECSAQSWSARYVVLGAGEARLVRIESRSLLHVAVAKIAENNFLGPETGYYISVPNFGIAIPEVPSLLETHWIMEQLMNNKLPAPDAVTVAQVLQELEDF